MRREVGSQVMLIQFQTLSPVFQTMSLLTDRLQSIELSLFNIST